MNQFVSTALIAGWLVAGYWGAAAYAYRKRWQAVLRTAVAPSAEQKAVRELAEWTLNTKISVCSVTGTWFSMTLAELAKSPVPYRAWNVPTSVEFHPAVMDVTAYLDQEKAKEHSD